MGYSYDCGVIPTYLKLLQLVAQVFELKNEVATVRDNSVIVSDLSVISVADIVIVLDTNAATNS